MKKRDFINNPGSSGIMHIVGPDDTTYCSAARAPARMFTRP